MSTLIFDFDGTIADTFFIAKDIFRKLATGRHPADDAEIEMLRSLTARQVIKRVGAKWWQMPYIMYYARNQIRLRQDEIKPIAGFPPVLAELHKRGHRLYIVSSNSTKNVQHFLIRNKLSEYFDGVYGGIGLFDKASGLRKIALKERVSLEECYYIGDEARDVEAARRAHMPCISVTWGYNSLAGLNRVKPETVIGTPKQLLDLV
jgi:phosphoglycolate phosphatase